MNSMKGIFILLLSTFGLLYHSLLQDLPYPKKHYNVDPKGLAIQGYDPVSYFTKNQAEEGNSNISFNHKGINYRFTSEANRKTFVANPEKYEPQYGGYCAYAMAEGEKVKIDPETFKIIEGKLYLFYNFGFTNTLKAWNKDEKNLHSKADQAWINIVKQ